MDRAAKRLQRELLEINARQQTHSIDLEHPESLVEAVGADASLFEWTAVIRGPPGSPFEHGRFNIAVQVPENYPQAPPQMRFATRVCHPNVHWVTGAVCLDLLATEWSPVYTIYTCLDALVQLLAAPNPDSPLNTDLAHLLRANDEIGYFTIARHFTRMYAVKN